MHCFKQAMIVAGAKMKGCWATYSTSLAIRNPMHNHEWHCHLFAAVYRFPA
jgi:hypothetical protein